jgi:hypothetical protein
MVQTQFLALSPQLVVEAVVGQLAHQQQVVLVVVDRGVVLLELQVLLELPTRVLQVELEIVTLLKMAAAVAEVALVQLAQMLQELETALLEMEELVSVLR